MKKRSNVIKFVFVNLLTFSRVLGSIILPIIYFTKGTKGMAIFVMILFLTDMLDGKLSRYFKVESFLGGIMDSASDKLFAFVMLAILSYEYHLLLIVILFEFIIFVINTLAFKENKNVQSSKLGKLKTIVLDVSISVMYLYKAIDIYKNLVGEKVLNMIIKSEYSVIYVLIGIMLGMQLVTICDYSKKRLKQVTVFEKIKGKQLKPVKEIWNILIDRDFYIENKDKSLKELLYK